MARLIRSDAHAPKPVEVPGGKMHACMCGLSANKPFCDGSHKKTLDERPDALYVYDKEGKRVEVVPHS